MSGHVYHSLTALVGNTPLVELRHLDVPDGVRVYAKLEGQNPSGSVKDRVVVGLLAAAAREGRLRPGMPLVEATTGNTGIALALLGRRLGHPVHVFVPRNVFPAIPRLLRSFGAQITWVDPSEGMHGAIAWARAWAAERDGLMLDQFGNEANPRAHYETTAAEILRDLGRVDVFVAGLGTGGTIMGVGRRLKEASPGAKVVAVEPHPGSQVQGLRSLEEGFVPPILDLGLLDGKILVRSASAFRAARELTRREGLFGGVSSGAVLHGTLRWCRRMRRGTVVALFADAGWKYLETGLWTTEAPDGDEEALDDLFWW
ncbi:MAG TPA: cysteine synthase family protein [Dehalococcoidia bacterium]